MTQAAKEMTFDEFCLELNEPEHKQDKELDVFLFFCFCQLFADGQPGGEFLALAAAHVFSKTNYARGSGIANRACRLRYPRMARSMATARPRM